MSIEVQERKWALVTGASQGLGAAILRRLAEDGYSVVAAARSHEKLLALSSELSDRGLECVVIRCDVSERASVDEAAAEIAERGIRLDALVNNAGTLGPIAPPLEADSLEWERTVEVNLFGVYRCLKAFAPRFAKGRTVVVNISSGASQRPMEGWSAYCASKAALAMLTRSLALEWSDRCLAYGFQPGLVDTDMQVRIRTSGVNPVSRVPREQLAPPEDPAAVVSWLCRERPQDLHGCEFRADDPGIRERAGLGGGPASTAS